MRNYLHNIGKNSKKASIYNINSNQKNKILKDYISLILSNQFKIISANKKDIKKAKKNKLKKNLIERLFLDKKKLLQIT